MSDQPGNELHVSFFATPPDPTEFPTGDYPKLPDGLIDPSFLPTLWDALKGKGVVPTGYPTQALVDKPPRRMMVRVSSVSQMGDWFGAYNAYSTFSPNGVMPAFHIQVVGHSLERGRLALTVSANPLSTWKKPFYWFDSNPSALDQIAFVRVTEVMVASCYVGLPTSNASAVNGRTLLFALSEMWRCRARAAVTAVDPKDFDKHGWYVGPPTARPVGWAWDSDSAKFHGNPDTSWSPQPIADKRIAVPAKLSSRNGTIDDAGLIARFIAYFDSLVPPPQWPRGVIPDVTMKLSYGEESSTAYLVSGALFLFVGDEDKRVCYANATRSYSADVADVVARLAPRHLKGDDRDAPRSA